MSDIKRPQGGGTLARKPWKAPRLIDLDELDQTECVGQNQGRVIMRDDGMKWRQDAPEFTSHTDCFFNGPEEVGRIS